MKTILSFRSNLTGIFRFLILPAAIVIRTASAEHPIEFLDEPLPSALAERSRPVVCWTEKHTTPRPLVLHIMRIDASNSLVQLAAAVAPDPDGPGPAQSALTHPLALAASNGLCAAVNANAFAGPRDPAGKENRNWLPGLPVTLLGWAQSGSRLVSQPRDAYWSVWVSPDRSPHVGNPSTPMPATDAVAGFGGLILDGRILPGEQPGREEPLHPRTAIGVDRGGRYLFLLVADGRWEGYSEGMTTRELAVKMSELGCWSAANMDGGGSSIMIAADETCVLRIINKPSDRGLFGSSTPRPVPTLIGVRIKGLAPKLP